MKTYELVCAFSKKEGMDEVGMEAVRTILSEAGASIKSENDMGDLELAYEIRKETHAQYRLFNIELNQETLPKIGEAFRLRNEVLRYLFIQIDE